MHKHAAVAGTFDHFHAGHRYLLETVYSQVEKVSLAITADEMNKGKLLAASIEAFADRKQSLVTYLKEQNWFERTSISTLTDIYGSAIEDQTLEALFTTPETEANGKKINAARLEKGMPALELITIPLLDGNDDEPISSSRIRLGVIDREGASYLQPFIEKAHFSVPVLVRDELRSPIGDVIAGSEKDLHQAAAQAKTRLDKEEPMLIVTVGDIVTQSLQKAGGDPNISFIDHRSRREKLDDIKHNAAEKHGPFSNKAGTIQSNVVRTYSSLLNEAVHISDHVQIIIEGEEDLLGLPAIMLAPLESVVLYGQFDAGIVYVQITEEIKRFCYEMLQRCI